MDKLPITLLTGPAACGKNTIAHIYATRYSLRCAVIDTDSLRWMLRNPHLAPWPHDPPDAPAQGQHQLGIKHACMLAKSFLAERCEVIICDVVGDRLAQRYRDLLVDDDFRIVLLLPTWEASLARLQSRPPTITKAEARLLYNQQSHLTNYDAKMDNTHQPAESIAARLHDLIHQG